MKFLGDFQPILFGIAGNFSAILLFPGTFPIKLRNIRDIVTYKKGAGKTI